MEQEKRHQMSPLPDNVYEQLSEDQLLVLRLVKSHGWKLKFVRRPINEKRTYVVVNDDSQQYAVLDDDGILDIETGIKIRL